MRLGVRYSGILIVTLAAIGVLIAFAGNISQSDSGLDSQLATAVEHHWGRQLVTRGLRSAGRSVLSESLRVLRSKPEAMPSRTRQSALETLGGKVDLGLRFQRSQRIRTRLGLDLWVTEGTGVVCLFETKATASTCNTAEAVGNKGLDLVIGKDVRNDPQLGLSGRFLAVGLVPDSVRKVRLEIGGVSKIVAPLENTYAARAGVPIDVLELIR